MTEPQAPVGAPSNTARDHAQVGQMIGSVGTLLHAEVVHFRPTVFRAHPRTPQEHLVVARSLLAAGAPTVARSEVDKAVGEGLRTPEVGYVRALSMLNGRAFDHLSSADLDALRDCFEMGRLEPADEHSAALAVVHSLLDCYDSQRSGRGVDVERLDAALLRLGNLPARRQEELGRHLGAVLGGAAQEGLDAHARRSVEERRMDHGRRERVPLFFQPDPIRPIPFSPAPSSASGGHLVRAAGGVAAGFLALLLLGPVLVTRPLMLLAVLAGAAGVVAWAPPVAYALRRRSAMLAEDAWLAATAAGPPPSLAAAELRTLTSAAYQTAVSPAEAPTFLVATTAARVRLEHELLGVYGVEPGASHRLVWLARHHAAGAAASWRAGGFTRLPGVPPAPLVGLVLSALVLAGSLLVGWGRLAVRSGSAGALAAVCGVVAGLLLPAGVTWYVEQRRVREQEIELAERARTEWAAYEAECERLRNRPTDAEMARWLDFDKDHVRLWAMKRYGLKNDDVVGHVLIAEPAKDCDRARDVNGPPRYSAYQMRLFLLTRYGVRQVDVTIDFASGAENGERRNAFRYDAIASARIEEPSVRKHGRRQVATPEGGGPAGRLPRPILRQTMELTLVNGPPIVIKNDFLSMLPDERHEDAGALESLAMDTSGAVGALRTLESVAADGRHWLDREQDRARFHSTEYQQRMAGLGRRRTA